MGPESDRCSRDGEPAPSASPFGPGDEIGMLNLIDAGSIARVMAEIDAGTVFDLSVDYFVGMPSWVGFGDPSFQQWMTATPNGAASERDEAAPEEGEPLVSRSADAISMFTHCGTHVDALNHFGYRGQIWNCFHEHQMLGSRHWRVCGVDRHPPLIARGVLIDVAGAHGVECLPESYPIEAEEIASVLRAQGSELRRGDIALIRTGRMSAWPDAAAYTSPEPGITRGAAEALAAAGAIVIGADNIALEVIPSQDPDNWSPVHTFLLAEAGVPIMEIVDLERLAAEQVHTFAFIGACLRIRGATGAPMRPIALPLRSR